MPARARNVFPSLRAPVAETSPAVQPLRRNSLGPQKPSPTLKGPAHWLDPSARLFPERSPPAPSSSHSETLLPGHKERRGGRERVEPLQRGASRLRKACSCSEPLYFCRALLLLWAQAAVLPVLRHPLPRRGRAAASDPSHSAGPT